MRTLAMLWLAGICVLFVLCITGCGREAQPLADGFLPSNNLWLEDSLYGFAGLNERDFNAVVDSIERVYSPIVRGFGANLVFHRDWMSSDVNAYADRNDGNWNVTLLGGLARRPEITRNGFLIVACHELFHHLGGYPTYQGDWAAAEGESDSGAAQVCAKKVLAGITENVTGLSLTAMKKCQAVYSGQDLKVCYHVMAAAKSTGDLLAVLENGRPVSFDTPSKAVVQQTDMGHPAAQCRLDEMAASAVCTAKWDDTVIPQQWDQDQYHCMSGEGAHRRCWFAQ